MRRLLLFVTYLSLSVVLFAEPVSKKQAQQIASQFLLARSASHRAPAATELKTEVVFDAVDEAGQPYLYAVKGQHEGFVLVSGDDRFCQVLGYSHSGTLDLQDMPDNMRAWLQGYVDEMKHLKAIGYQPSATTAARRATAIKTAITPLIQTTWNQGAPYNNTCPAYTYGTGTKNCVTGCVATAMAQVMNYYRYPDQVSTTIPGYTNRTTVNETTMVLQDVPAGTTINWDNMLASYSGNYTEENALAVANLMLYCGTSVAMNYATSSEASSSNIPHALKTYFGYNENVQLVTRANFTYADWTDLIYSELAASRPVLYGGQSSGGGHAFVVDGYDGAEMFHVNWGWGGHNDDYFALSVMNPGDNSGIGASSSNDGYSFDQNAVVGISPNPVSIAIPLNIATYGLIIDSGKSIKVQIINRTGYTQTIDEGLGYYKDGELTLLQTVYEELSIRNNEYYTITCYLPQHQDLAGQTVTVYPIYKLSSETDWHLTINPDINLEVEFDENGNPTAKKVNSYTLDLQVTDFSYSGSKFANESQPVEVTVKNNGGEFYGVLYLFASTTEGTLGTQVSKGGLTILKGKTATATFEFVPEVATTYYLTVTTDKDGSNSIGTSSVVIENNPASLSGPFVFSSVAVADADENSWTTEQDGSIHVNVYSQSIAVTPTVKNISSENSRVTLYFTLYQQDGSSWAQKSSRFGSTTISSGGSANFSTMTFENVGYGTFKFVLSDGGSTIWDERYIINTVKGYAIVDSEGKRTLVPSDGAVTVSDEVVAVDLSDFDFTDITPNTNPNTLYIIGDSQTAPASLTGKNVVKDGVAERITLTDGYAFYSPIDFKANTISYSRTESVYGVKGTSEGWTTLVLPFAAKGVKTVLNGSDYPLTWFTSGSDTNKNLWLMEFGDEVNSVVEFSYVQTLEANKPYIMALPGDSYGNRWSLVGLPIIFYATNADITANAKAVTTGTNYKFVGTTVSTGEQQDIYALNAKGDSFEKGTATVQPFRAYFAPTTTYATAASLAIGFGDSAATGINVMESMTKQQEGVFYNLNGQRVAQPAKGLYIVNGKKVIIK